MIHITQLSKVVYTRYIMLQAMLYEMMTDYNKSPALERDEFTAALFRFLKTMFGYAFNDNGSFTEGSAWKVIAEETNPKYNIFGISFDVVGRFDRLEKGKVDFRWIWDKWLEDAIREPDKVDKWVKIRGVSRQDIAIIKKGPPDTTPARPYVAYTMKESAKPFGDDIDRAICDSIRETGRRFR